MYSNVKYIFFTNQVFIFQSLPKTFIMGEEGTFYKAVFILGVTFTAGVVAGYKVGHCSTLAREGEEQCDSTLMFSGERTEAGIS